MAWRHPRCIEPRRRQSEATRRRREVRERDGARASFCDCTNCADPSVAAARMPTPMWLRLGLKPTPTPARSIDSEPHPPRQVSWLNHQAQ